MQAAAGRASHWVDVINVVPDACLPGKPATLQVDSPDLPLLRIGQPWRRSCSPHGPPPCHGVWIVVVPALAAGFYPFRVPSCVAPGGFCVLLPVGLLVAPVSRSCLIKVGQPVALHLRVEPVLVLLVAACLALLLAALFTAEQLWVSAAMSAWWDEPTADRALPY